MRRLRRHRAIVPGALAGRGLTAGTVCATRGPRTADAANGAYALMRADTAVAHLDQARLGTTYDSVAP